MLKINNIIENKKAKLFCKEFIESTKPKFIFGINEWAESIADIISINGYIDEFTNKTEHKQIPIVPLKMIPNNALVVSVVQGKPFVAEKKLSQYQFDFLDYYSFYKYSNLPIKNIMFWDGMIDDIKTNLNKYNWIYNLLEDQISKNQFYNIINFRLSYDINYMRGFQNMEKYQYFEPFLQLKHNGECFADIGSYDGYTTKEFIKRCPQYDKIFIFEPEETNMKNTKNNLKEYNNIHFFQNGISNKKEILKFDVSGSSSKIDENGSLVINVDTLDNLIQNKITFIKMDIEGYEQNAILGSTKTIKKYHPKLAISVYHKPNDLWKIPELILNIREDYRIYLRHYTEGISETIMFFIPIS
jgi:FkbM family methyltransferase